MAREFLPTLYDHIAIKRIELHQERFAVRLLVGAEWRATATEEIKHVLAWEARILECTGGRFHRFLGEIDHRRGVDLVHVPQVGGVVRAVVMLGSPLFPTVEAPLVRAYEVHTGENQVLFIPDDGLAEIKLVLLEERRGVAAVRKAAPNIERAADVENA